MISCEESNNIIHIETPLIQASIQTAEYVSGVMAGTFRDQITGVSDPGFGLHIMDFLLASGWRDDGYIRERMFHGNLPKHYVEGPQIYTQAKKLDYIQSFNVLNSQQSDNGSSSHKQERGIRLVLGGNKHCCFFPIGATFSLVKLLRVLILLKSFPIVLTCPVI